MKLRSKLVLSFSFVVLLLAGVGAFSQYYNQQIKNQLVVESEHAILELTYSGEMGLELYQSLLNAQYFLDKRYNQSIQIDTSNFEMSAELAREKVRTSLTDFKQSLDSARTILQNHANSERTYRPEHEKLSTILEKLEERSNIYESLLNQLFELSEISFQDGREFLTVTVEPYFRKNLIPLLNDVRQYSRQNMNSQIASLNSRLEFAGTILAIATITALLIALGLAFYLNHSIASPLKKLSDTTKQIGKGNLDERIQINSKDEIGDLASEFNRMAKNLSKITFSKEYVDNIIESMGDALLVTDCEYRIKRVNSSLLEMLNYKEQELLGQPLDILFSDQNNKKIDLLKSAEDVDNFETSFLTRHEEEIPVNISKAVMQNADGSLKGLVCVASDITDRKKAEQQMKQSLKEKEILLAEIHHRVKNNLAVISGMLEMQIWETENEIAKTALRDSQLRVRSIALVHEKLYQSESLSYIEFDTYIQELLDAINSAFISDRDEVSIQTQIDSIALNINQAIPCSLLINELVVNAHKHAFSGSGGKICISLEPERGTNIHFHSRIMVPDSLMSLPALPAQAWACPLSIRW
ncbi:MAG: histidine kinase dimerization/phosphoacceptor domain -containing protein [Balneolaceae bacterium]|nr:histidine kinase dimerization/phosphoacceptor domain -containing protein [Balneolaceae bacterium]